MSGRLHDNALLLIFPYSLDMMNSKRMSGGGEAGAKPTNDLEIATLLPSLCASAYTICHGHRYEAALAALKVHNLTT